MKNVIIVASIFLAPIAKAHICDRSPLIQKQIIAATHQNKSCRDITDRDLLEVEEIAITYDLNYHDTYGYDKQGRLKAPWKFSKLKANDLKGLFNLKYLDLQFTNITEVKREFFRDLKNLEIMDLSHNLITKFDEDVFWDLKNVKKIEFDSNEYLEGVLPEKLFRGLTKLEDIDMDQNNIKTLPVGIFNGLINLKSIDLANNNIKFLPVNIFNNLPRLHSVLLSKNPIAKRRQGFTQNYKAICYRFCLPS